MFAIFHENGFYRGHIEVATAEETADFELPFDLMAVLPAILSQPTGGAPILRISRNVYELGQPPTPALSEMDSLRQEITFLRDRDARMQDDISSIIEGLTGGV